MTELTPEEIRDQLAKKKNEEPKFQTPDLEDLKLNSQVKQPQAGQKSVLSLFSGAGGLDLGVEIAGLKAAKPYYNIDELLKNEQAYKQERHNSILQTTYVNDNFNEALKTHKNNFPEDITYTNKDIRKITAFPESNIILGGFPCPGYSLGGLRLIDDTRNFLYTHFVRAVKLTRPDFFIAENVKGLMTLGKGEVLKQVIEDFEEVGYTVTAHLVNARDYGVPQSRERVFLIGVNKNRIENPHGFTYELPKPTHSNTDENLPNFTTLKEAISDLQNNPGHTYESGYSSIYMSRNRKKSWDEQSFTIQASARQAPQHPGGEPMRKTGKDAWEFTGETNRRLATKEIARIQTFPDWFDFTDGKTELSNTDIAKVYKQVGNAVPVKLAAAIAAPIAEFYIKQEQA